MLEQLERAWREAKRQLEALKEEAVEAQALAQASAQASALARDKDVALRNLGEAVWLLVKAGKLQVPALAEKLKAVERADQRAAAQSADIRALLAEGEEAADRARKPLATRPKKR